MDEKVRLRRRAAELLGKLDSATRRTKSRRIVAALLSLPEYVRAARILCYAPLPSEPDIMPFLLALLAGGRVAALPRCVSPGWMDARRIETPDTLEPRPPFGVREPGPETPVLPPSDLNLVLVPGLLFDREGRRLGHGKGYYDRYLAGTSTVKAGICFSEQLIPHVPTDGHDIPMEILVTDREILRFSEK